MLTLLEHEASMLMDIHQDSSLLVLAEGMGMDAIVYSTIKLHSDPHNLLLVSNYRLSEARFLSELLKLDDVLHSPGIITAEVCNKDREAIYKRGGVVFVTSRILVVDLLMDRMPASLVSGVLILRAHELQEACQENFAVRLLRDRNPSIFIKALSDNAVALTSGFNHAEQIMMQTGISKLVLWPRFNIQVVSCLSREQPRVEEVRVPLTPNMAICQSCILDLTKACIKELVDQNPSLDTDELNLESALLPNFDRLIGLYLDPIWNQLSSTSRRLVSDIASLRRLLRIFIEGEPVSFLDALEEHRQAALSSLGISRDHTSTTARARQHSRICPSWFLMDQSDRLLKAARARVYSDFAKKTVNIEMNPKWRSIVDILRDIYQSRQNEAHCKRDTILILVGHEHSAKMLERYLTRGVHSVRRFLRNTHCLDSVSSVKPTAPKVPKQSREPPTLTLTQLYKPASDCSGESESSDSGSSSEHGVSSKSDDEKLPVGCRRVHVSSRLLSKNSTDTIYPSLDVIIRIAPSLPVCDAGSTSTVDSVSQRTEYLHVFGHRLAYVLDFLQPRYVILYEPRVSWVRELEVHKARRNCATTADEPLKQTISLSLDVFFMLYENSVEEQRYLTHLRREKEAFESLIHLSSRIVIPQDAFLSSSVLERGSSKSNQHQPRVIVDMREFRSELPALLYRKGLKIDPMTLSVADYILAPHLCVERKSVSDLVGSLNSGRLYQQCTAMSRHYPYPILLIEFSLPTKITGKALVRGGIGYHGDGAIGFSLYTGRHSIQSGSEFNAHHLLSKLALLTIHFPNLRLFWSVTPYCTAELFVELKQGRTEPSVDTLPQDGEHLEDHNVEAVDMLLKLPGISWKNYRRVINKVSSLYELARCSLDQLIEILDSRECATQLYNFLHLNLETLRTKPSEDVPAKESVDSVDSRRLKPNRVSRLALAGRVKTRRGRGRSG